MRLNMPLIASIFAVLLSLSVTATAYMAIPNSEKAQQNGQAPEHSPVIDVARDGSWAIERIDFVHYAKPTGAKAQTGGSCYKLMGVKWDTLNVPYAINPANPQGLNETFVTSTIAASAEAWDAATSQELFNDAYSTTAATYGSLDGVNAIDLGDYPNDGVIAVTSVWYNRFTRKIVEFDMRFNTRFVWGNADETSGVMDLRNIATHELGHAVGMADIYSSSCGYVTMYGYSGYGDTAKRSLEQPDITGLQKMYGA